MRAIDESVSEVAFSDMLAGDTILIYTANSQYTFAVLNPCEQHSRLMGEALGATGGSASLLAAQNKPGGGFDIDCSKLKAGARHLPDRFRQRAQAHGDLKRAAPGSHPGQTRIRHKFHNELKL